MLFWHDMAVGTLVFSRRAKEVLDFQEVQDAIERYEHADWGDVPQHIREYNPQGVVDGGQVVGLYRDRYDQEFWIITEPKHEYTHIKLADESWDEK